MVGVVLPIAIPRAQNPDGDVSAYRNKGGSEYMDNECFHELHNSHEKSFCKKNVCELTDQLVHKNILCVRTSPHQLGENDDTSISFIGRGTGWIMIPCPDTLLGMTTDKPKKPNPTDSWLAPEHARMGQGMKRFKHGVRGPDGLFIHPPGVRVLPEPECLRFQNETDKIKQLMVELGMKFIPYDLARQYLYPKKVKKVY